MEADHWEDLKDFVFDFLAKKNVEKFSVYFDGNGDSGQIEDIDLPEEVLEVVVQGVRIQNGMRSTSNGWEPIWEDAKTFRDVVDGLCYQLLEDNMDGWEIDEGSFGNFIFSVNDRKLKLEYNERIIDIRYKEYDL